MIRMDNTYIVFHHGVSRLRRISPPITKMVHNAFAGYVYALNPVNTRSTRLTTVRPTLYCGCVQCYFSVGDHDYMKPMLFDLKTPPHETELHGPVRFAGSHRGLQLYMDRHVKTFPRPSCSNHY